MVWSQGTFYSDYTCFPRLSSLVATGGAPKGECWRDRVVFTCMSLDSRDFLYKMIMCQILIWWEVDYNPFLWWGAGIRGDKRSLEQRTRNDSDTRRIFSILYEETTLHFAYVGHFYHLLLFIDWMENRATEVLTLEVSCVFVLLIPHSTINHHRFTELEKNKIAVKFLNSSVIVESGMGKLFKKITCLCISEFEIECFVNIVALAS